ncbi:MAG: Gldg family protein, partial [Oligoflexia bacterium]|nr:Gldg family protein [Oligoflexia bacterium]
VKARSYGVDKYGVIVAVMGGKETTFDKLTESDITNAIIKLSRKEKKMIYFLTGHGERDIESEQPEGYLSAKKALDGQSYDIGTLNLMSAGAVPNDSALLIIAGPKKAFFKKEAELVEKYIKSGGAVYILSDPGDGKSGVTAKNNVAMILDGFGVRLRDDIIVDPISRLFGVGEAMPVVQTYDSAHDITSEFNETTFFPFAQSVDLSGVNRDKYVVTELCKTTPSSWGEMESKSGTISFNKDRDIKGPLVVAAVISAVEESNSMQLVVYGNSGFVSNQFINHAGNLDLFMNTVSFLAQDDDLISIRPRKSAAGTFELPGGNLVPILSVYLLPFLILVTGIIFWFRRRKY